jgi:hypothetical protein
MDPIELLVESEQVFFKKGYKYQLTRQLVVDTGILNYSAGNDYITLFKNGLMVLHRGYAWDGASSFPDFDWIIRGSCGHDGGYQLLREGLLPLKFRVVFDNLLGRHCVQDGSIRWVAKGVTIAVKRYGEKAVLTNSGNPELALPKI